MADKRINALTTATNSTSDDFFAIDGTTNGTKKLSAFSPTFGGNATVTGTLTVNSTSSFADRLTIRKDQAANTESLIDNRNTAGGEVIWLSEDGLNTEYAYIARYNSLHATTAKRKALEFGVNGTGAFYNFASGVVKMTDTTASTTTSSGALVVSGGVGVGGAIYAGGNIVNTTGTDFGSVSSSLSAIHTVSGAPRLTLIRSASSLNNKYFDIVNNSDGQVSFRFVDDNLAAATTALSLTKTNATVAAGLTVTTNLAVNGTTASTSTSSGSLVCSGGVGVAGAIYVGGAGDFAGQLNLNSGTAAAPSLKLNGTNNGIYYTGSNIVRIAANGAEAATFGGAAASVVGSLQTGAPSGGTAAAWKLGTVASVSPTSPNRTIEVDIGGTIYYIHAKTTNN